MFIGEVLLYHRKKCGYTQADVAAKMSEKGYPTKKGSVYTWEKGIAVPNAYQYIALRQILDIHEEI